MSEFLLADERPLGIDVSKWQGRIDWAVIAAHVPKVLFCGIRASIGADKVDEWFSRNWEECGAFDIYRAAYHLVIPGVPAVSQMDNFYRTVPDRGELPRVLDYETIGNQGVPSADLLWECATIIAERDESWPIVYSRRVLINQHLSSWTEEQRNKVWWWLAQYLFAQAVRGEHPGPPVLPQKVRPERALIHQTADKLPGFGVESSALDRNRWLWPEEHLHQFVRETAGEEVEPPDEAQIPPVDEGYPALIREARRRGWNV